MIQPAQTLSLMTHARTAGGGCRGDGGPPGIPHPGQLTTYVHGLTLR